MLHRIRKAKYLDSYKVELTFNTGSKRIIDLEPMLKKSKGIVRELLNLDLFKQLYCDGHTICWPNEVDFCPNVLFKMSKNISGIRRPVRKAVQKTIARRIRKKALI